MKPILRHVPIMMHYASHVWPEDTRLSMSQIGFRRHILQDDVLYKDIIFFQRCLAAEKHVLETQLNQFQRDMS